MQEQARNVIIGVFVLAAICLVVWLILFLHPTVGDGEQIVRVRFANIEKISLGSRVTYAGRPVGKVVAINQIYDARTDTDTPDDRIYPYELILAVDSHVKIFTPDEIVLRTSGLFGERTIAIIPRRAPEGDTAEMIKKGSIVYAENGAGMEEVFNQISSAGGKIETAFEQIAEVIEENRESLHDAINAVKTALTTIDVTFKNINESDLIDNVDTAATHFSQAMQDLDVTLKALDEGQFGQNLSKLTDSLAQGFDDPEIVKRILNNFDVMTGHFKEISGDIAQGKGTIGQLVKGDALYLRTLSLMNKGNTLLTNFNQYGILFNLNRKWQRKEAGREVQAKALRNPTLFRACLGKEVKEINQSLDKVSALIDKAPCPPLEDPCFTHEFANLLRSVKCLQQELELYNDDLCTH